ncbi:MAG: pyruvate kinase [Candidatus Thiodiazotropha taylori]|uniref:Pyruvate kinase n=1 Tax=Candidatus Thiodiazotropha taylori TaxID=2792791 RepID=A0A9E4N431_9GAMM|nr:pyruvate kinase [Candidatus Thiodiazotropha taylori]MCW4257197.1 pyruvate kinase [Candidatus Thiodiazotropha taylori]
MIHSANKVKIIGTIGPASDSEEVMQQLLLSGMNVARLNFSHGDFSTHQENILKLRRAAESTGKRLAIMADLPGPKMRIGEIPGGAVELHIGDKLILTTEDVEGTHRRVSVSLKQLPKIVSVDDKLFLNDGLISLKVEAIEATEVHCEVRAGGELSSRKGLNLPGIDLGFGAFTEHDRECLEFALQAGVDAVSQSFVSHGGDIEDLLAAADKIGRRPFVIAKIERLEALENLDSILEVSDGIMVARGDLGVEIPISRMAVIQKELMERANHMGKPVITATQMLESMTAHRRPTRAEATDVANAILDGTDAVMLSAESAVGRYPVEAVEMLARIAADTEPNRKLLVREERLPRNHGFQPTDLIAHCVQQAVIKLDPAAVIVPTRSGSTARNITRYRLPVWIDAFSNEDAVCQALQFSYGVYPVKVEKDLLDWGAFTCRWLHEKGLSSGLAILTQGPSPENPGASYNLQIADLSSCRIE